MGELIQRRCPRPLSGQVAPVESDVPRMSLTLSARLIASTRFYSPQLSAIADQSQDVIDLRSFSNGKPSAIVIGAGFAGLGAAGELQKEFKVTVLESRNRIGGRVHTDRSFGFPVDLGASWIHGMSNSNPLIPIIKHLRQPLYQTSEENSVLYDHDLE
ncbi:hypothetical protein CBR_g59123, partial [Chara braunii]